MTEDKVPTYQEWLKERQIATNENRARATAYHDQSAQDGKWLWTWIRDSFLEINRVFNALEWAENYRLEDNAKIIQATKENYVKIEKVLKTLLGLEYSATEKDIEERAKILGNMVEGIVDKAKRIEEDEQKLKDKVLEKE